MVMIVTEMWYPVKVASLVGQRYLEMMQKPIDKSFGEDVVPPSSSRPRKASTQYMCGDAGTTKSRIA